MKFWKSQLILSLRTKDAAIWKWACNAIGELWRKSLFRLMANEKPWTACFPKLRWKKMPKNVDFPRESLRKILERWRQTRCSGRVKSDDHANYRLELGKCKGVAVLASCYWQFTSCKISCKQETPCEHYPCQGKSTNAMNKFVLIKETTTFSPSTKEGHPCQEKLQE